MNIDTLIDKIIENKNKSDYERLFDQLSKMRLYFFIIDDGSFSSVDEIVFSGKDRPISIPTIEEGNKKSAVLYTSKKVALRDIQKGFRISYTLKGINSIEFLNSAKGVSEIILQGERRHISISKSLVQELINSQV